jgi:primosomal replication protein N
MQATVVSCDEIDHRSSMEHAGMFQQRIQLPPHVRPPHKDRGEITKTLTEGTLLTVADILTRHDAYFDNLLGFVHVVEQNVLSKLQNQSLNK